MKLLPNQIRLLVDQIHLYWNPDKLNLFASDMGVNLFNEVQPGNMRAITYEFISGLNSEQPPRIGQMLTLLAEDPNQALAGAAKRLNKRPYESPTGDEHDAVLLGDLAFIGRPELRDILRDFSYADNFSVRMLVLRGGEPCGKTYSWWFIDHLAKQAGANIQRIRLKDADYTPRELFKALRVQFELSKYGFPKLKDDPQESKIHPYITWLKGKLSSLDRHCWLVIDDLNHPNVRPSTREAAYAIGKLAQVNKGNLWVVLVGYNEAITERELRKRKEETPQFPSEEAVAEFLQFVATLGPRPLTAERARQIAKAAYQKQRQECEDLKDIKESMERLTPYIEDIAEQLKAGNQP